MDGFAHRLTQLRENKDLSKRELSKILHVSDSCVSQYENGSSMPGYDTLLSISQYFGVSVDYLLGNNKDAAFPLDAEFCDTVNYYTLLSRCNKLSPQKRQALLAVINALLSE